MKAAPYLIIVVFFAQTSLLTWRIDRLEKRQDFFFQTITNVQDLQLSALKDSERHWKNENALAETMLQMLRRENARRMETNL